jgi:2-keto-4-pentenoate hydratase
VRTGSYTKEQVADAVDAIYPAIEIGDSRLIDRATAGMLAVCADNAGGTELVLGDEISAWQHLDLANHRAALWINDQEVAHGYGREVMDDPLNSLVWLVDQQMGWGHSVPAGSLVATGTCTGINIAQSGDAVTANFGVLGKVQIKFEG